MTYCVAMRVDEGLVFLSDSRTNAGIDHVSTFRKMVLFEVPDEQVVVLLSAGNLAITQAVTQHLASQPNTDPQSIWRVRSMHDAARLVGDAVRAVHARDAQSLSLFGVDFNCSFIVGGQVRGEAPRLFQIYAAGNFIEASPLSPYVQIGEAKYGKPIIDRMLDESMPLADATKCALISMNSTIRSNVSVGLPVDLFVYERDALRATKFATFDEDDPYYWMLHATWAERQRSMFDEIPNLPWDEVANVPPPRVAPERTALRECAEPGREPDAGAGAP
ncbi:peptidase [Burkholderia cenocepacia]|uniref:peptidase n=1 Tax=Burkholderia cepacia complex TaxID=87882 RepID=UPI00098F0A46|nr:MULTISPECIES: peptidase [Burkholderia cepacia complex]MBR8398804.1 peptidase [Burkholderia cenocepacia]MDN7533390.1 peptidase [Burkholderia orbicola]